MARFQPDDKPATDEQVKCIRVLQLKLWNNAKPVGELKALSFEKASDLIYHLQTFLGMRGG